jgi:hypothetical protein
MGCTIHIVIQIFDQNTGKYLCVRESESNSFKIQLGENAFCTVMLPSTSKLLTISSEELENLIIEHETCDDVHCQCQVDFGLMFNTMRDYITFSKIAGVRSRDEKIQPKGLPDDIDDVLCHIIYERQDNFAKTKGMNPDDFHSHTYISDDEIDNYQFEDSGGLAEIKDLLARVRENFLLCKSRFIIFFDN